MRLFCDACKTRSKLHDHQTQRQKPLILMLNEILTAKTRRFSELGLWLGKIDTVHLIPAIDFIFNALLHSGLRADENFLQALGGLSHGFEAT